MNSLSQQLRLININPESLKSGSITKSVPVYSSINGFVSKVNVNIGKYVNPSDVLFELINPDDIHLNLKVYEKDLQNLKKDNVLWLIPMQIRQKILWRSIFDQ
jgi:cobalt-zinc-cadmium efflux system membrane fusion protein